MPPIFLPFLDPDTDRCDLKLLAVTSGFIQQNIYVTLWLGLGGAAIAFLVVVPPFPFYNQSPENWLPSGTAMAGSGIEIDGRKIN